MFPLYSIEGIVSYFKKQVGPASVELKDDADLQKFISDKDGSVVGELLSEFKSFLFYGWYFHGIPTGFMLEHFESKFSSVINYCSYEMG